MSGNSKYPMWMVWIRPGSANVTFFAGGMLALVLIGVGAYWMQIQSEPHVSLLAGAKLLEHDLGRMQLAFGGAGLNDFEVRDGQVFVPQSQRDRFLKALNDHDGIPETSREMYEPESLNPWATSQQVQESTLLRKKKMIRQLVLQLEFVADAVVDYDELVDAGWPPTTRRSAAIVVRPQSDRLLESYQVDAIRNTICGAVAGLTPTDIVITDIAAGHAYVGPNPETIASSPEALDWLERAKIEQRIRDQMTQFGQGIEVHVTLENHVAAGEPSIPLATTSNRSIGAKVPLANQPATINSAKHEAISSVDPLPDEIASRHRQSIHVRIRVPEQWVREFAQLQASESQGEQTLEQQFQSLQAQIRSSVQPLLAIDAFREKQPLIDVTMIHLSQSPIDSAALPSAWLTGSTIWPAVGLVLGAMLIFVFAMAWKFAFRRESRHDDRLPLGTRPERKSLPNRQAADSISDETKRKLKQMVDDDPDQAAEIIKQWIRDAA